MRTPPYLIFGLLGALAACGLATPTASSPSPQPWHAPVVLAPEEAAPGSLPPPRLVAPPSGAVVRECCMEQEAPERRPRRDGAPEPAWMAALPDRYAERWVHAALAAWHGRSGNLRGALVPMAARFTPGVPVAMHLGFIAAANRYEDNGRPMVPGGSPRNVFNHELGWWGLEGGPTFVGATAAACRHWHSTSPLRRQGAAPSCLLGPVLDPAETASGWMGLRSDREVVALLGRRAGGGPDGWMGVADQVAVGLVRQREHGRTTNAMLPPAARALDENSQWFAMLSSIGWSAGDTRAARHIRPYAEAIARVPESRRWGALLAAAAADVLVRRGRTGPAGSHRNFAFSLIRATQKMRVGRAVARQAVETCRGVGAEWFELGLAHERWVMEVLTRAAYGAPLAQPLRAAF